MSQRGASVLTRLLASTLAAFREIVSAEEMATSIVAAVIVEHEKRPFTPVACDTLSRIVEPAL